MADASVTQTAVDPQPLLAAWTLCQRELVRFFRQKNRVFGAIGQPVIFWLLFGAGLGPSFQLEGVAVATSYRAYFFPGTLVLILLFTAIFATISIIEDRREGFLQSVLVAPIPRWSMVLGKVLGGTLIAMAQGLLFLLLGLTLDLSFTPLQVAAIVALMFVISIALTALGFVIAWRMESTQGFHAIMSVFLLPMWLLSGAFFPAGENWLGWIIKANPLTYGVAALRRLIYWHNQAALPADLPALTPSLVVTCGFAAVTFSLAVLICKQRTTGDLL